MSHQSGSSLTRATPGPTLVRPALERLRDLAAQVPVDVVVCYSPDRLARKLAYQTLLIDELNKAGSEVRFVKARKVETPEDEMLLQFQGMMAEYERALIIERTRRGKAFRARSGMVNVLCGAPYGFRYIRRTDVCEARYEIVEEEAQVVREVFRRYTEEQASIGELARWLSAEGIPTRTGKDRWDRSVIWAMLRNPAYVGRAAYLKTGTTDRRPAINRQARLQGRSISRHYAKFERPARRADHHRRAGHHRASKLRAGRTSPSRQPPVRGPQQQRTEPAHGPCRLPVLRVRVLPDLDPDRQAQDLLLPLPGLRRLPLPRRQGL